MDLNTYKLLTDLRPSQLIRIDCCLRMRLKLQTKSTEKSSFFRFSLCDSVTVYECDDCVCRFGRRQRAIQSNAFTHTQPAIIIAMNMELAIILCLL